MGMDERAEVRNPFENDLAALLTGRGITANPSHAQFTFAELKGNKEQIRQRLLAIGAEAALFVHVTDQADFASGPPASLGSMDMGAVDESRYNALTRPGGDVDTSLRLGTRLYRVSDGAVVWSGLLQTLVKEDYDSMVLMRNVARTIVAQMAKDKVIPK